ncbi:hypothetical protein TKK_0011208 [Trichogramma kaykai]|uniref:Nudix hydrolase domain-containing protein n=1 Tax=Trichogramma kaykai TaxID=54128 RepID=A0ABD2WVH5_9HYME
MLLTKAALVQQLLRSSSRRPSYPRSMATSFNGKVDRYDGITVDSAIEPCPSADDFSSRLRVSLENWIEQQKRTIWFKVDTTHSHWIPELTRNGFKFHHAKGDLAMLYRWLPANETCNVPPYAHTNIGAGAVVLNEANRQILVVKERHGLATNHWKLPGGYVEPGEDICDAAEREVREETGIIAKFKCLIAFRHVHSYAFGCSDIYFVSCLTPETFDITRGNREISECQWMKLEDFIAHPQVHDNNRQLAIKVQEYLQDKKAITMSKAIHPISGKRLCVYGIADTKDD